MSAFKTALPPVDTIERQWWVVDADGLTLGRLATEVASILRGKRKPSFTPHLDVGDFVIVINAEKVAVSGNKDEKKIYRRHTGYPGGLKEQTLGHLRATFPERIIEQAVKRMLPRNRLGRATYTKLKVYAGPDHPHIAQQPQALEIAHAKRTSA